MAGESEGGTEVVVEERDVRSAIRDSISEARERLGSGESLIPVDEEADDVGDAAEVEDVPADPDADEELELQEGDEAAEADVEGEDGAAVEAEGDEAAEEDDLEGAGEDEGGEDEEAEPEVIALPGRREDDPEVEIEVDDPDVAERLRQLSNMGLRGRQFRERITAVEEREAEQAFIDAELEADPAGFLLSRVSQDHRKEILRALLAEDELYEDDEIQEHLREWEIDPDARKDFRKKHKDERETKAEKRRREAEQTKAARAGVRQIASHVSSLIPDDMSEEDQTKFYRVSMRAAEAQVMQTGKLKMDRDALIEVLDNEGILRAYSIDPGKAASKSGAAGRNGSRRARATARSKGPAKERQPTAEEARSTGDRLKERSKRRRAAAAAAPAGAGAPAASIELPEGQSVKERIRTVRKKGISAFLDG